MTRYLAIPLLCMLACRPHAVTVTPEPVEREPTHEDDTVADEPAHLAGVFRHTPLAELQITERVVDETVGRVKLELAYFEVSGIAASLADPLNRIVREAAGVDAWAGGDSDRVGTVTASCTAGLAYADLVSFGCNTMNDTRTVEDHENATGGSPAGYTGVAGTYAISDGKLIPVQLADLLKPEVDLVAFVKRVAGDADAPYENWRDGNCELGKPPVWQLDTDGLRLWDQSTVCNSILIPYEKLAPIVEPGGVIARYVAITQPGE